MATLILEEGGNTRRFRLNQGKVTIGSGESCTLTIADDNVAEVHAELELLKDSATLRLKKGVMPAVVNGRKVSGEVALAHGVPVKIGNAKLSVEYEGKAKDGLVAKRTQKTRAEASAAKQPRAMAQRTRPRVEIKPGAPTWLTLLIIAGVVFAGYLVIKNYVGSAGVELFSPQAVYDRAASRMRDEASAAGALSEIIPTLARPNLDPEWREKFEALRKEAEDRLATQTVAATNTGGTEYLDTQIKRFETKRLDGNAKPNVRVLLLRMHEFIDRWPTHDERDWVERRITRYSKIVDLDDPPSYDDVAYEVKTMTWASPRDYLGALAILDKFSATASAGDQGKISSLLDTMYVEQEAFFNERLEMAEWEWKDGGKPGKAVVRIVQLIVMIGDEEMANTAASVLVQMTAIEEWLRTEKVQNPKRFAALVANPIVHEWAKGVDGML